MLHNWRHFGIALLAFLAVSGFFSFTAGTQKTLPISARALDAMIHASITLGAGLALGLAVWGAIRLIKGKDDAPDVRETVMVLATVFGIVSIAIVMFK